MELYSDNSNTKLPYLIHKAVEKRSLLYENPETDCFRIFNSSGDGIDGLTADYYDGYILLQYFNRTAEDIINKTYSVFAKSSHRAVKGILCKNRMTPSRDEIPDDMWKSRVIEGDYPAEGVIVHQNGVKAKVDLVNGQNTGVFLDMREVRDQLAVFYRPENIKRMLNLFSYTALFSVHAIKNGVDNALNIDLSKGVLSRAKVNYNLNGIKVDERDFIYGDALEWTGRLSRNNAVFDFAVFDPPTFARNKKKNFSVKKDYSDSLRKVELLLKDRFILTSVNSYTVTEQEYRSYHPENWELLMLSNESSDFVYSSKPYLKVGLWKI